MKIDPHLEHYRIRFGEYASPEGATFGTFHHVPGPCGDKLTIVADDGAQTGWQHVSVSKRRHTPNWIEMCWVKDRFWEEEECVVQFHPPRSRHVNNFSTCLHLWRYIRGEQPMPPDTLVGYKELGELA